MSLEELHQRHNALLNQKDAILEKAYHEHKNSKMLRQLAEHSKN